MKETHWAIEAKEAIELLAEKAALLDLQGIGINEQVKQLATEVNFPVTRTKLLQVKRHPKYQEIKKKAIEAEFENGTLDLKRMAVELLPDVYKCLKDKLKDGDTKAAALVVNLFIGKEDDSGPKQAQQIQVILPGTPKVIKQNPV